MKTAYIEKRDNEFYWHMKGEVLSGSIMVLAIPTALYFVGRYD